MLFANIGRGFMQEQTVLIHSISDRSLFVVNDTRRINKDTPQNIVMSGDEIGINYELVSKVKKNTRN